MGYEHKIIVAQKVVNDQVVNRDPDIFSITLAEMKLSRTGSGFDELFTKEIDWQLFSDYPCIDCKRDIEITTDCYGDTCTYTDDIQSVIAWLEQKNYQEHYRRYTPAIAMLKAYVAENWDHPLILIHYGY